MKCLLNLPVLFLLAVPASAQIDARKGDVFTLMVSPSILYEDGSCSLCNGWTGDSIKIFSADITPETTWVGEFPALLELQVEKIDTGKEDYVEVELRNRAVAIKLRFHTDHSSAQAEFARAVVAGDAASEATQSRLAETYEQIAAVAFQGGLSIVPPGPASGSAPACTLVVRWYSQPRAPAIPLGACDIPSGRLSGCRPWTGSQHVQHAATRIAPRRTNPEPTTLELGQGDRCLA